MEEYEARDLKKALRATARPAILLVGDLNSRPKWSWHTLVTFMSTNDPQPREGSLTRFAVAIATEDAGQLMREAVSWAVNRTTLRLDVAAWAEVEEVIVPFLAEWSGNGKMKVKGSPTPSIRLRKKGMPREQLIDLIRSELVSIEEGLSFGGIVSVVYDALRQQGHHVPYQRVLKVVKMLLAGRKTEATVPVPPPRRRATDPLDLLDLLAQRGEFKGTDDDVRVLAAAADADGLPQRFLRDPKLSRNRIREAIERARRGGA